MDLFALFVVLNMINVIVQTTKSICTVKCGKWTASIINGIAFGIYTILLVYMSCGIPLWQKVAVSSLTNLVGVFIVKLFEEKFRKDKLWKIEFTINNVRHDWKSVHDRLDILLIPHIYFDAGSHTVFTCYCSTKERSAKVKDMIELYEGKYFASESKVL